MTALLALVGREWKLVLAAIFAVGLFVAVSQRNAARQALTTEKAERAADRDRADRQRVEQERGFAVAFADAVDRQAARTAAREPIIVHSTNTVREYAQTDAGRARCLGPDRVRGLDAYLAALTGADPAPAPGGADAVRADANPARARR